MMKTRAKFLQLLLLIAVLGCTGMVKAQSEQEKFIAFSKEPDWKLIRDTHFEIMDRIVTSKADINTINFSDETGFLSLIQLTRTQYLNKTDLVRAAAQRLARKYGITQACDVCTAGGDIVGKFKTLAASYQKNIDSYNQYRTEITGLGLSDDGGRCCGWRFYLCCTVCAGTIAAFPAYLACCALCFDTYCCKP